MNGRNTLIPLAALCIAATARGADDAPGANLLAAGGAGAAHPSDNAAVGLNPAALALAARYDVHGIGHWTPAEGWTLGASAVDSRDGAFALGLGYARTVTEPPYTDADLPGWVTEDGLPPNTKRWHEVSAGAAFPLLERKLSLGVGGVLGFADHERYGRSTTGNVDVGVAGTPVDGLTLGLVGRNLLPLDTAEYPAGILAGVRYHHEGIGSASLDLGAVVEGDASPWQLGVGVDAAPGMARVRAGYRLDRGLHHLTWGLGIANEAGGFDYAMVIPVGGEEWKAGLITHALSVRLFL